MTRSIRNFLATHNLLAVSARRQESAINTEQDLDTTLLADLNTILNYQAVKFTNREELTGKEEPDRLHDFGGKVAGTLSFSRAQPQHFGFLLAYGLGAVETAALADGGFRHTIRPRYGEVDVARSNPSFTAAMRLGRQVLKRRFTSCFVDQVRVDFPKDGWAKINAAVKGTGKVGDNTCLEEIVAHYNAGSLTLAASGVAGESATERLSNVQAVQVLNPVTQAWDEVAYSAVSGEVPGAITISPPAAGAGSTAYRIYYLPRESDWTSFPPRLEEPPLKVNQVEVTLGGRWDGNAFAGGSLLAAELRSITWTMKNYLTPENTPGAGSGYANRAFRYGREQNLKFDRDFRDFLMAQHLKDNDTLAIHLKAEGPEFAPGVKYQVELVFPRVAVLNAPIKVNQRRLGEEVEFAVLEDDNFGSVIAYVQNQVSSYAA
ncbi:MAG: hypothetical protein NTY36_09630 [Deltaproteobacteria bacterium]|nr:hypothetical protein [Deltaproteobacteria bacterium]